MTEPKTLCELGVRMWKVCWTNMCGRLEKEYIVWSALGSNTSFLSKGPGAWEYAGKQTDRAVLSFPSLLVRDELVLLVLRS